jgi:glycosyltransferase involved in cell wall biosynthesis
MQTEEEYPIVSVIIPCFNREEYIATTIDSVLSQTWPNIELIVVDDGCIDGSRAILESYGNRIIIYEHAGRTNKGQSAAINLGLGNCRGKYIAILDSDDLFAPEKIEKQVKYLEDNPEIGMVYANGKAIDENGKELFSLHSKGHQPPSGPESVLENCTFNLPSNSLVCRSVYDNAGLFDETLRSAQDHDMAIRICEVAKVGYIDEYLWFYRRHAGSISHTKIKERWRNGFRILDAACKRYPYPGRTRNRRRAVLNFRLGQCYMEEKSFIRAGIYFLKAGLLDPLRSLDVMRGRESVSNPRC